LDGKTITSMDSSDSFHQADREIIGRLQQGGTERRRSEEQFFNRFAYFIREGMTRHALSEDDAFNAYSDTILASIEKIINGSFEGRSSLKTYLYQIFNNKCVDLLRKKTTNKNSVHRTDIITDKLLFISDSARTVVQKLIDKADWSWLREKLNELEEKCRQLLVHWGDNYSDREIATAMDYKTADVVKTSRLRCLEKLRRLYKIT
jgi:RNA polymerase sigma factor (sigma-70 family)